MDIITLREKRNDLEINIMKTLANIVSDFKRETGFSPRRVDVDMVEITGMGAMERNFIVGKCKVEIEI